MKIPPEQVETLDLPDIAEIYSDSLQMSSFDGSAVRMTFCVSRMQEPKPQKPPRFKRYPVARLVMGPDVAVDLFNQLNQIMGVLNKIGMVKIEQGKPPEVVNKGPSTVQ